MNEWVVKEWVARGLRLGSSLCVAIALTTGSLALVAALNDRIAPAEPPESVDSIMEFPPAIVVQPPPKPDRAPPTPAEQPRASSEQTPAQAAPPRPAVAAPAIGSLIPPKTPSSVQLPPGLSLPQIGELPRTQLPTTRAPLQRARPRARPQPRYPAAARREGIEGFVTVRISIDARGTVQAANVVRSQPQGVFDRAALEAVRRYRFEPARRGEQAVASELQQTIRFELAR